MLPGFTAQVSLYRSKIIYRSSGDSVYAEFAQLPSFGQETSSSGVVPASCFIDPETGRTICTPGTFVPCQSPCYGFEPFCICPYHVCPIGETNCGGTCKNLQNDPYSCGSCGHACLVGQFCENGICQCPYPGVPCGRSCCPWPSICRDGLCCPPGQTNCSGVCVNPSTSSTNCGSCGNVCEGEQTCQAGTCQCPSPQTNCGGICTNFSSDPNNCGKCGNACGSNYPACVNGQCCTSDNSSCQCPCGVASGCPPGKFCCIVGAYGPGGSVTCGLMTCVDNEEDCKLSGYCCCPGCPMGDCTNC
jgi:hypothetical protein